MSERKCVNCRHRIIKGASSYCELSGNFLHYSTVFEHWCKHWAKDKFMCGEGEDGKQTHISGNKAR